VTRRLLLDVDTGTDDAGALLLAATWADFEVVAATATWGNCSRDQAAANTLAVLRAAGCDAPVHPGEAGPRGPVPSAAHADLVMMSDGLGGCGVVPPPDAAPEAEAGAEAIVRWARAEPGELTLVATAPLSTVAAALALEPQLPSLLADVVVMGGSIALGGNLTAAAEANIGHDPTAAAAVVDAFGAPGALASGRPPMLVSLDATLGARLTDAELEALGDSALPGAPLLYRIWSAIWPTSVLETGGAGEWPAHDLLAIWALVDADVFTWETLPVAVDVGGSAAWGSTVVDRRLARYEAWAGDDPERLHVLEALRNVSPSRWAVATAVDADRFRSGVRAWLARER